MKSYDLVVIGSGAGLLVLEEGLKRGLSCALVERDNIGGTCLNRGCIPSKVVIEPADLIREAERAARIGLRVPKPELDWEVLSRRLWAKIGRHRDMEENLAGTPNLTLYRGTAEFTGERRLRVARNDGSGWTEEFEGGRVVVASGGRTFVPPIPGLEETGYVTTELFFGSKFPGRPWPSLVIIGGGIIAAEFAHAFSAFGTKVTLVEMLPRLLSTEEPEVGALVERVFRRHMEVLLNSKAVAVRAEGGRKVVTIEDAKTGAKTDVAADEILVAVGRRSNADLLHVEKTGLRTAKGGWIAVNEFLETNVPGIWAIGDATGVYQFRHKANADAYVCAHNLFSDLKEKRAVDYSAVPWAVYTHPQVGHVGMTEAEARAAGQEVLVAVHRYSEIAKGYAMGFEPGDEDDGFVKLVTDKGRRILGAHVVGPQAAILVQPFVYLMTAGASCPEAGTVLPIEFSMVIHPSLSEVTGWAVENLEPPAAGD